MNTARTSCSPQKKCIFETGRMVLIIENRPWIKEQESLANTAPVPVQPSARIMALGFDVEKASRHTIQ